MKNYFLLIIFTFIELIICLVIYSLNEGFWHELRINCIDFSIKISKFNFANFINLTIYWFINLIFENKFKFLLLNLLLLIIYNFLIYKKIIKNKIQNSILFFVIIYILFIYYKNKNFYFVQNLNETIITIISLIITSIFISKITKRIMRLIN
jgi:hypothetical protein